MALTCFTILFIYLRTQLLEQLCKVIYLPCIIMGSFCNSLEFSNQISQLLNFPPPFQAVV